MFVFAFGKHLIGGWSLRWLWD